MRIVHRNFTSQDLLKMLRRNIHLYVLVRKFAGTLSKYFFLEEGFDFLKNVCHDPEAVALDIGSNDGTSIALIRKAKPRSFIHSFDPVHKLDKKITNHRFHNLGLSSKVGIQEFFVPKVSGYELTQYASAHKNKIILQVFQDFGKCESDITFRKVESEIITLDLLKLKPFFIKIDVEGHELHVLRGAVETLKRYKPILLLELQNFEHYEEVRNFLKDLEYLLYDWPIYNKKRYNEVVFEYSDKQKNYIWISRERSRTWKLF